MEFGLTEEQRLLQETVREFVRRECPPMTAKAWDDEHVVPNELFSAFSDLGWLGLLFPPELGGAGASAVEMAIVVEELGRSSLDVALCLVSTVTPGLMLLEWAKDPLRSRILSDVILGRRRLATGISEPDAGSDVAALSTTARLDGDELVVNGTKMWCTGAGLPNTLISAYVRTRPGAEGRDGISLVLVDPSSEGVSLSRVPTLARHILGTYEVVFTDVRVPVENVVGPLDEGWQVLLSTLDLERVLITAGYVGAAQATLDEAVSYAKQRSQFGRPIGDFQALSHGLADLHTEIAAARLLTYNAAWLQSSGQDFRTAGSMAKLFASETYVKAARWGMQVMGGYGFSTESVMSFRYRESIVATISGGTSQIQKNGIARSLGLRPR